MAAFAKKKHLCFFLGAGTSIPAGMPSWAGLLELVNKDLDYPLTEDMWAGLNRIHEEYKQNGNLKENESGEKQELSD